ncbi:hypothetical protein BH09MYX1_BH09MYX1_56670 [soil metagenome]
MEQLHALAILAWALVRSLLAPLVGARRGLAAFRASYAKDHLPPVTKDERNALRSFSGCIACGRCDVGEAGRIVSSHGTYGGVMDLVLASSRSMPDYDAAAKSFAVVTDAQLAEAEARCPTLVPMREIRSFVVAKAAELEAS